MDATSYVLELSDWVTFSISSFTVYGNASNFTFTGLVPGRYYSISVTVNCTGGSYVSGTVYDSTSRLVKWKQTRNYISGIKDANKHLITKEVEVNEKFCSFYKDLYQSDLPSSPYT
ncbi:unnamed protein product [Lampetra fluviatilis]